MIHFLPDVCFWWGVEVRTEPAKGTQRFEVRSVCPQCTRIQGQSSQCSQPCSRLPAPRGSFSPWDGGGPVAGVSSRDEQGLPELRTTSYFLPGLRCPEQIAFALFVCLGNRPSPSLSRPALETWTGSWDSRWTAAARVCPKLEAQVSCDTLRL